MLFQGTCLQISDNDDRLPHVYTLQYSTSGYVLTDVFRRGFPSPINFSTITALSQGYLTTQINDSGVVVLRATQPLA